jgi:hypothetical protein
MLKTTYWHPQESILGDGVVDSELSVALVVAWIISAPKTNDGMLWLVGNSLRILILDITINIHPKTRIGLVPIFFSILVKVLLGLLLLSVCFIKVIQLNYAVKHRFFLKLTTKF